MTPAERIESSSEALLRTLEEVVRSGALPETVSVSTPSPTIPELLRVVPSTAAPRPRLSPPKASASAPEPVPTLAQVSIAGLVHALESEVRALMSAREASPYSPEMQAADLKSLLGSGLFSSVSMRRVPVSKGSVRLDIRVTEGKPRLRPGESRPDDATLQEAAHALGAAEGDIPPPPWVLGEIEIKGNRNVKTSVIRRQILGRKGDLYSREDHDRDLKNVLNLGGFERVVTDFSVLKDQRVPAHFAQVSASEHPIAVSFVIEEKPLISAIRFEGRDRISKGRIKDELSLHEHDPFDRTKLREDGEKVLELYHKKGYHRAKVDPRVEVDTGTLKAVVVFAIDEGPKARIEAVRISGLKAFTDRKIRWRMKSKRKKVFSETQFKEDLKSVESFYKNRGYLDFAVLSTSVTLNAEQTKIFLDLALEEGNQYRFGDTRFSGYSVYSSSELVKAIEYRRGKLFSQERFDASVQNLRELYAERGRLRTLIEDERTFDTATGLLNVHFKIAEGNTVYVDHIDIEGNKATKTYVFHRELVIKPGMAFSVSKIKKSVERIRNLGFIDDVQPDVQSPFDPDLADITFEVFEGKPGMLSAGAGFSSLDGLIGTLSLQHLNLFGRAYRTSVAWSFGSRVNDFSVGWATPWIKDKPISLGLDLFNTRRVSAFEGSSRGFTHKKTGAALNLGPRFFDDKYRLDFRYTFQKITVSDVQNQFLGSLSQGTSISSVLGVEAARDTRDNIWDPGSGTRNSIGMNLSGGPLQGNIHFWKPFVSNSAHKTLVSIGDYPLVLSFSNRVAYVTPFFETKEVPVFERMFVGGQDSLRGYSGIGEVGARNGGKVSEIFNIELGFPLARERKRTIVKFVTFFDAGSAWENMRSVHLRVGTGERDIKTDIGFGIRFTTPAFPIRLDWGYGFQHRPGEERTQINFGIGSLF